MQCILHKLPGDELHNLMHQVRSRGLEGPEGTWEQFLKVQRQQMYNLPCPYNQTPLSIISFLATLDKKEDQQLLMAWITSPTRALRHHYSNKCRNETVKQALVRMTLTRVEHPLEYYLSPRNNPEDWLVTGTTGRKNQWGPFYNDECKHVFYPTKMISLSCDMVLCEDGSEAPIRVVVLDRDCKLILNEFVKPSQPVSDLRTDITGLTCQILNDATFVPLADVQAILRPLVSIETIMVGHGLDKVLAALKIDHARIIDTSLVFTYDHSGFVNIRRRRRPCNCFPEYASSSLTLEKPCLKDLCKCVFGYDMPSLSDDAVVALKLVLAVVEKGTWMPLPTVRVLLGDERSKRQKIEEDEYADVNQPRRRTCLSVTLVESLPNDS